MSSSERTLIVEQAGAESACGFANIGAKQQPKHESECVKCGLVSKPFGVVTAGFRNLVKPQ
jgi:hypothetical protein